MRVDQAEGQQGSRRHPPVQQILAQRQTVARRCIPSRWWLLFTLSIVQLKIPDRSRSRRQKTDRLIDDEPDKKSKKTRIDFLLLNPPFFFFKSFPFSGTKQILRVKSELDHYLQNTPENIIRGAKRKSLLANSPAETT